MSGVAVRAILLSMVDRKRVLIAGGGVAALEAALALQDLASDLVEVELIAPEPRFWYRPLAVAEPFGLSGVPSFDLAELANRAGALFTIGSVTHVDASSHFAGTSAGHNVPYDALLLACGALPRPAVTGASTFRGPADTPMVADVVAKIASGGIAHVVVTVPLGAAWSLPAYELALMLAGRGAEVALVTPEDEPLLLFGEEARDAIRILFDERGIALHTGFFATEFRDGKLRVLPAKSIETDCVVALPALQGPRIDGIPQTRDGFVVVDAHGRVEGLSDVYAAGDLTRFPVKQGGLAAQQAVAAAEAIAAAAGAALEPQPFRPVLRGLLLTGGAPRYLRRDVAAAGPSAASVEPLWWPPAKIVGQYLAPFLAEVSSERE
jgi:sulfide:quinone oxidoreductase